MKNPTYWWKEAKIYELYIDKFAGDLKGLTSKLDYFTALGINCLHLLPHYPSPMVDDGYDVMDYRNVRAELGTLDDFADCLLEAHRRDIRVIVDLVLNHVSAQHPWFVEARASRGNPKRNFFLWSDTTDKLKEAINCFPDFKPLNWIANDATKDYYFATFYPEQPDLNWDNPEVMNEMLAVMDFWITRGVDGFRLDAASHLIKREGTDSKGLPETHQVLKRLRRHLDQTHPDVVLLAEINQTLSLTKSYFGDGDECHMVYHFPLMKQLWLALLRSDLSLVETMVKRSFDIPERCQWATFLRNHDDLTLSALKPKETSALLEFLDPTHKYFFDGGEGASVRIATIFKKDQKKILEAFTLLYGTPGAPIMYYGDEIGMENLPLDPTIKDTRKYVRGKFDWEEAERQMSDPASLWNSVARIIKGHVGTTKPSSV